MSTRSGDPPTFDWGTDCVPAVNQVAVNLNIFLTRNRLPRSVIFQKQIAIANLKSAVVAEDVVPIETSRTLVE